MLTSNEKQVFTDLVTIISQLDLPIDKTLLELNKLLEKLMESLYIDEPETLGYMLNVLRKGISSLSSQI